MNIVFAGAGTGGHLMTGLSLAQEIKEAHPESRITFFLTSKSFEENCVSEKGFLFKKLKYSVGSKGSIFHKLRFLVGLVLDTIYSCVILRKIKPDLVVGLGGYSSAPPIIAALLKFTPFVLIDQNLIPGKVNRIFSKWAKEVYCHFSQSSKWFEKAKSLVVTGNPVRKEILDIKRGYAAQTLGLSPNKKSLLVLGGSQGARAINEVIINCLRHFKEFEESLQIIHCTGEKDFEEVSEIYKQYDIEYKVLPFMRNIELAYSLADLVVSRAGAGTVTEITALGLPSILIPYPFAADNHQYYNALEIEKYGAAYLINQDDFTIEIAVKLITELLTDDGKRERMIVESKKLGKPNAANVILNRIENLIDNSKVVCSTNKKRTSFFPYFCK